jgi:carboxymethylenebutenolidase
MSSRWDTVTVDVAPMRCYVSAPSGAGPFPGVIVIQHAGGVDEFIQSMCDRLAVAGYMALAPDLYHREDMTTDDNPLVRMTRLRDANIVPDVNAAFHHLSGLPDVRADRIGITGFCMGGRVAYLMAARNPGFRACVDFYGGSRMVPWGEGVAPFDITGDIRCPVMGLYGEDDPNPSSADVAKISAELTRFGIEHEFHSYPGAGHAFMTPGRPMYREAAARDAWEKCLGWFERWLKG